MSDFLKKVQNPTNPSNSSASFENLPDVLLFKIFSYLYIGDLCRVGRVCIRWYNLSRCHVLWRRVDAHDMELSTHQIQKLVPILPSCVQYLHICSLSAQERIPFLAPHTTLSIRERCPRLHTLIIERAFIAKHIHFTDITVEDLPQELSVLSLRKSFFHTDQFFCSASHPTIPRIRALDCSWCWCIGDHDLPFLTRLGDLQEIHLSGCQISDEGAIALLKAVEDLKILDLENTNIGLGTFQQLGGGEYVLEKLYLGHTEASDDAVCCLSAEALPKLRTLCLRQTCLSIRGIFHLVRNLRSVRELAVSLFGMPTEHLSEIYGHVADRGNLELRTDEFDLLATVCEHFFPRTTNQM